MLDSVQTQKPSALIQKLENKFKPEENTQQDTLTFEPKLINNYSNLQIPYLSNKICNEFNAKQSQKHKHLQEFAHGTTTLAFKQQGGAVIAVDSRASMGQQISDRAVMKALQINEQMFGTMAGGAADCQQWLGLLKAQVELLSLKENRKIKVSEAACTLLDMLRPYSGSGLSIGSFIVGQDQQGLDLYFMNVGESVFKVRGDMFSCGSGSTFAQGCLDTHQHWDMSKAQALDMAKHAIYHATVRDFASGGYCTIYHFTMGGVENIEYKLDVNTINKEFTTKRGLDINLDNVDSLKKEVQKMKI